MKSLMMTAALALAVGLSAPAAHAMNMHVRYFDPNGYPTADQGAWATLEMTGDIVPGDLARFKAVLAAHPDIHEFRLNSYGGVVMEAIDIATIIHDDDARSSTTVYNGATCASSCFWLWAAGHRRNVASNARIGVHSLKNADTGEESEDATIALARFMHAIGIPDSITMKMIDTTSDQIAWLNEADYEAMNAHVAQVQVAERPPTLHYDPPPTPPYYPPAPTPPYYPPAPTPTYYPPTQPPAGPAQPPNLTATPGFGGIGGTRVDPQQYTPRPPAPAPTPLVPPTPVPAPDPAVPTPTTPDVGAQAFADGERDRRALESWVRTLSGDYKDGALYWAEHRSDAEHHLPAARCDATPTLSSPSYNAGDWWKGCTAAQARLAPLDARRHNEPAYKAGWNAASAQLAGG